MKTPDEKRRSELRRIAGIRIPGFGASVDLEKAAENARKLGAAMNK